MKEWKIIVKKLTDGELLRAAASMTIGNPSSISVRRAYALGHSLQRTQLFWIEFHDIPLSVMGHIVRHIHAQPYVLSKRPDRGAEDFSDVCNDLANRLTQSYNESKDEDFAAHNNSVRFLPDSFGRKSPTSMGLLLNAEEIVNISRVRLCNKAAKETSQVWANVVNKLEEVDPDLAEFCVPACVHQGFCRERPCCGFTTTDGYKRIRNNYKELFK